MHFDTLIFDLDGTISDPLVGITRSVNYALESLHYDPVDPERIRPLIGPPLTEIFGHLLGPLPGPAMQELIDKYRDRYARVGYAENRIYEDIPGIVGRLAGIGYRLGVCTSKREDYAKRIIDMFGLGRHFAFVSGGAGIEKRRQVQLLVATGLAAGTAIMIGDRAVDILAGSANGMASAGVLWGFGGRGELEDAGPNYLLEAPAELLDLLMQ